MSDPRAFLVRVSTRLAIDRLRRVKARRESYVGPWLPEPLTTDRDAAQDIELAEPVSMAMLIVLETLSPLERAVFVLRETFGMPYSEISEVLGRSEVAVYASWPAGHATMFASVVLVSRRTKRHASP